MGKKDREPPNSAITTYCKREKMGERKKNRAFRPAVIKPKPFLGEPDVA